MTTIVNFIEGNFIANPQEKDVEKPFWVLDSSDLEISHRPIVQSLLAKCKQDKKPLLHLDLGLSSLPRLACQPIEVRSDNGIIYVKQSADTPYYLVKTSMAERKKQGFLTNILEAINKDASSSGVLRQDKGKCSHNNYEFGLFVEGIQAWSLLNRNQEHYQKDIEEFITGLGTTSNKIRQITAAIWSNLLSQQENFHLERSSTCLTKLQAFAGNEWKCLSTVRRYNGFSNQEEYSLQVSEAGRAKVIKKKKAKGQERSKDQIEMVSSLGFTVQKDQASRQQEKQLKEHIFPHLKMRQTQEEQPKCQTKKDCKGPCACEEKLQDLIILDEQQEDQDDIDV